MARNRITVRNGRRVQPSGPRNALGLVKFDLRNGHAIYLHDTPSKSLFLRDERHASHGCVRVHDALAFAEMIARGQRHIRAMAARPAAARGPTRRESRRYVQRWLPLQREIPVRLLYHTAYVENGRVVIVRDVYGRDAASPRRSASARPRRPPPPRPARPATWGPDREMKPRLPAAAWCALLLSATPALAQHDGHQGHEGPAEDDTAIVVDPRTGPTMARDGSGTSWRPDSSRDPRGGQALHAMRATGC